MYFFFKHIFYHIFADAVSPGLVVKDAQSVTYKGKPCFISHLSTAAHPLPPSAQPANVVLGAALGAALPRHSQGKVPPLPARPVDSQKLIQGVGAARGGVFGELGGRIPAELVTE